MVRKVLLSFMIIFFSIMLHFGKENNAQLKQNSIFDVIKGHV